MKATKDKKEFVLLVPNIKKSTKWKATKLYLGIQEEKPLPKIAKCYAKMITEENRENKQKKQTSVIFTSVDTTRVKN